ncbi:unnamed protein product [Symbiodinium sp. CCMP2592]|nr:unnamed protein product [Symbiodinium sp. CCMP2592]
MRMSGFLCRVCDHSRILPTLAQRSPRFHCLNCSRHSDKPSSWCRRSRSGQASQRRTLCSRIASTTPAFPETLSPTPARTSNSHAVLKLKQCDNFHTVIPNSTTPCGSFKVCKSHDQVGLGREASSSFDTTPPVLQCSSEFFLFFYFRSEDTGKPASLICKSPMRTYSRRELLKRWQLL